MSCQRTDCERKRKYAWSQFFFNTKVLGDKIFDMGEFLEQLEIELEKQNVDLPDEMKLKMKQMKGMSYCEKCKEKLKTKGSSRITKCRHHICGDCHDGVMKSTKKCPVCNKFL